MRRKIASLVVDCLLVPLCQQVSNQVEYVRISQIETPVQLLQKIYLFSKLLNKDSAWRSYVQDFHLLSNEFPLCQR